jgi:hypothetical protein
MTTIPLSNLVPAWRGDYTPEAYAAVEKGLRHQRARFLLERYLVISFVFALDYDGCFDHIYFDAGFRNPEDAAITCPRVLKHRMQEALIRAGTATMNWHTMKDQISRDFSPRIDVMAWEKRGDGSGYNAVTVYVGVLEMTPGDPLTGADLEAIGHQSEVKEYLCRA